MFVFDTWIVNNNLCRMWAALCAKCSVTNGYRFECKVPRCSGE